MRTFRDLTEREMQEIADAITLSFARIGNAYDVSEAALMQVVRCCNAEKEPKARASIGSLTVAPEEQDDDRYYGIFLHGQQIGTATYGGEVFLNPPYGKGVDGADLRIPTVPVLCREVAEFMDHYLAAYAQKLHGSAAPGVAGT